MMDAEKEALTAEMSEISPEGEEVEAQVAVDIDGGGAQPVDGEVNPFQQDGSLEFVNIRERSEPEEEVQQGTKTGLWGRVAVGYASVKAMKTNMTQDLSPWTQFADRKKFSVPSKTQVFGRVKNNLRLYHANYLMLLGALAIWTAVSNLTFVLAMLSSVGMYYYYRVQTHDDAVFKFFDREVHPIQFYIFLTTFTLLLFWLTGGGSTMFWMVASAAFVVFGHASFRETEENEESISPEQALQALNVLRS